MKKYLFDIWSLIYCFLFILSLFHNLPVALAILCIWVFRILFNHQYDRLEADRKSFERVKENATESSVSIWIIQDLQAIYPKLDFQLMRNIYRKVFHAGKVVYNDHAYFPIVIMTIPFYGHLAKVLGCSINEAGEKLNKDEVSFKQFKEALISISKRNTLK